MGGRGAGSGNTQPHELTEQEKQSIREYQGGAYSTINHALRDGTKMDKDDKQTMKDLDNIIEDNKTTEDITVYRGFADVSQIKDAEVGSTISDKGYVSTSTSEKVARGFSRGTGDNGKGYVAEIRIPKGSSAADVNNLIGKSSMKSAEKEMILGKSSNFSVDKVSARGNYNKVSMTYKG